MRKIIGILFLCVSSLHQLTAQIFPREDSRLYWRLIGFSFPAQKGAITYKIEIAKGTHNTESSFEKNIISSVVGKKNKIIGEVPSFGCEYTWRIVSVVNAAGRQVHTNSALHHFGVKITPDVDTSITRLRVIKSAEKYKDHYVFIDDDRVLYDMNGKPVWCLPGTDLPQSRKATPRDLKATPQGTITFFTGFQPYEINYAGDILWHYHSDTAVMQFHHEFTRLNNGHYMGMILEDVSGKVPTFVKGQPDLDFYDSAGFYRSRLYSSIVEYDENKQLVWKWSGLAYENNSDLRLRKTADFQENPDADLHENAFFLDEKNKTIYLSFRNISRIIKIKYPEGNVINTYGTIYKPGTTHMENSFFSLQHCCRRSSKGYLYLFNNNTLGTHHIPTIARFQEPGPGKSDLKKIWEYECTVEGPDSAAKEQMYFNGGGSVMELPDQSILAAMSKPYPKVFIVSLDKKILWSAMPERYDPAEKKWKRFDELYRASIISRKELEQIIWNSEK